MIYLKDLYALTRAIKQDIQDDYLAFEGDEVPGIQLTIGWTPETDDLVISDRRQQFTGGAYGHPIWAVAGVYRDSNCLDIAKDLINQLYEQEV